MGWSGEREQNHNKNQWRVQWVWVAKLHQTLIDCTCILNGSNPITYIWK